MRLVNAAGRAALVIEEGIVDVAAASGGALSPDPQLALRALGRAPRPGRAPSTPTDAPLDVRALAGAGAPPPPGVRHRPELRRPCRRGGRRDPDVPADVHEVPDLPHRAGRDRRAAERVRRLGGRARGRDRPRSPTRSPRATAGAHVAGLTVGQDLSERIVQTRPPAPQFSLGKSFPGFGPIGPWVVTPDELDDPDDLALGCTVERRGGAEEPHLRSHLRRGRADPPPVVDHPVAARRPHLHGHPVRRRRRPARRPASSPRRRARLHHRRHRHHPHPPRRRGAPTHDRRSRSRLPRRAGRRPHRRSARSSATSSGSSPVTPPPTARPRGATTTVSTGSSSRRVRPTTPSFVGLEAALTGRLHAGRRPGPRRRRLGHRGHGGAGRRPPGRRARPRRHAVGRPVRARARARHARATPFDSPLVPGGFVTKDQGFGHVVFVAVGPRRPPTASPATRSGSRSRTGSRRTSAGCR